MSNDADRGPPKDDDSYQVDRKDTWTPKPGERSKPSHEWGDGAPGSGGFTRKNNEDWGSR